MAEEPSPLSPPLPLPPLPPSKSNIADEEAELLKLVMEAEGADMGGAAGLADHLRQQQMQLEMYQRKTRTGVRRTSSSTGW